MATAFPDLGSWNVKYLEEEYHWEPLEMSLGELRQCLDVELGGVTFADWFRGLVARRPDACQVLIWFLRLKAGRPEERAGINIQILKLELDQVPKDEPNSSSSELSISTSSPEPDTNPPTSTD